MNQAQINTRHFLTDVMGEKHEWDYLVAVQRLRMALDVDQSLKLREMIDFAMIASRLDGLNSEM